MVKTVRSEHGQGASEYAHAVANRSNGRLSPPVDDPDYVHDALLAEINEDRWIVNCPFYNIEDNAIACMGAELVDLEDLRFFCLSCGNAEGGGRWVDVEIPA